MIARLEADPFKDKNPESDMSPRLRHFFGAIIVAVGSIATAQHILQESANLDEVQKNVERAAPVTWAESDLSSKFQEGDWAQEEHEWFKRQQENGNWNNWEVWKRWEEAALGNQNTTLSSSGLQDTRKANMKDN